MEQFKRGEHMNLILYTTSSDKKAIDKSLQQVAEINDVTLLQDTDIINPTFILDGVSNLAVNYLYAPAFNRYYFITNIALMSAGRYGFACHVDVLMSWKNQILSTNAIIERGATLPNTLIPDDVALKQVNSDTVNKILTGGELLNPIAANNYSLVLTCYGIGG